MREFLKQFKDLLFCFVEFDAGNQSEGNRLFFNCVCFFGLRLRLDLN